MSSRTEEGAAVAHEVVAEMVANVLSVAATVGTELAEGDTIVVLESMKMEIPVLAEHAGRLLEVHVAAGDVVQEGDVLAVVS